MSYEAKAPIMMLLSDIWTLILTAPFTEDDPLVSMWCNVKFLQISFSEETNSYTCCMAWSEYIFSKFSFRVNYSFKYNLTAKLRLQPTCLSHRHTQLQSSQRKQWWGEESIRQSCQTGLANSSLSPAQISAQPGSTPSTLPPVVNNEETHLNYFWNNIITWRYVKSAMNSSYYDDHKVRLLYIPEMTSLGQLWERPSGPAGEPEHPQCCQTWRTGRGRRAWWRTERTRVETVASWWLPQWTQWRPDLFLLHPDESVKLLDYFCPLMLY